jgi:hypothetical protein
VPATDDKAEEEQATDRRQEPSGVEEVRDGADADAGEE